MFYMANLHNLYSCLKFVCMHSSIWLLFVSIAFDYLSIQLFICKYLFRSKKVPVSSLISDLLLTSFLVILTLELTN